MDRHVTRIVVAAMAGVALGVALTNLVFLLRAPAPPAMPRPGYLTCFPDRTLDRDGQYFLCYVADSTQGDE